MNTHWNTPYPQQVEKVIILSSKLLRFAIEKSDDKIKLDDISTNLELIKDYSIKLLKIHENYLKE